MEKRRKEVQTEKQRQRNKEGKTMSEKPKKIDRERLKEHRDRETWTLKDKERNSDICTRTVETKKEKQSKTMTKKPKQRD